MGIVSLGWFGHRNCGDEAFKQALLGLFPGREFEFVNNIPHNLELINRSDYLLIGGGNIIDSDFLRGLEDVKIPYSFVGVGIVEGNDIELLSQAETILVRDHASFDLISSSPTWVSSLFLAPDLTFVFKPNPRRGQKLLAKTPRINSDRPTIGVFLNDCVSGNFDSTILKFVECERVKLELARFLESLNYNILFIPMSITPPDDRRISLDVIGKMKNGYKYWCITDQLGPLDCLDLASALDFAFTMRLHSDIFCTIAGIPFVDLLHHDKNKNYLATLGESELGLNYYGLNAESLAEKFFMLENDSEDISRRLLKKAAKNRCQLEELIQHVHIP